MDITDITQFIKILEQLPTQWKVFFIFIFFGLPKLIQTLGGGTVVRAAITKIWNLIVRMVLRYQARKSREAEDQALTEAYTRTLVIESLHLFSERLRRMDHKINYIVLQIDPDGSIEIIEDTSPKRNLTDTIIHERLHERLAQIRRQNED